MDEKICGTPITGKYVADHMKTALGPHAILRGIKNAKRIGIGQGFASNILRMELEWENEDDGLPKSVIIKVPFVESIHEVMDTMAEGASQEAKANMVQLVAAAHKNECDFYHMLWQNKPISMPKCYVAVPVLENAPGMMIMEDLSVKGSIAPSFIQGFNLQQTLESVTQIARLNAWSMTTQVDWRSCIKNREDAAKHVFSPTAAGFKATKEQYPEEFGSLDLEKLAPFTNYETYEKLTTELTELVDDVLIHGDFQLNNILFEKKPDGTVGDKLVAVIDFQAVRQASLGFDLGRVLALSLSPKLRRDHTEEILHRYYDEVKGIAGDKFKATFDQVRQIYEKNFAATALCMVSGLPIILHVMVRSQGEQKIKDEQTIIHKVKEDWDDAVKILGL